MLRPLWLAAGVWGGGSGWGIHCAIIAADVTELQRLTGTPPRVYALRDLKILSWESMKTSLGTYSRYKIEVN